VVLAPGNGPDPLPGVWVVRQGAEVFLSYDVTAGGRRRRDDLLRPTLPGRLASLPLIEGIEGRGQTPGGRGADGLALLRPAATRAALARPV
jgi:hypothetical protein